MDLLGQLEHDFAESAQGEVNDHRKQYDRAARMVLSPNMRAFDLAEPDAMRDAYGKTQFGSGCLLARRLIEAGVTFIEIDITGWDTHWTISTGRKNWPAKSTGRWPNCWPI